MCKKHFPEKKSCYKYWTDETETFSIETQRFCFYKLKKSSEGNRVNHKQERMVSVITENLYSAMRMCKTVSDMVWVSRKY